MQSPKGVASLYISFYHKLDEQLSITNPIFRYFNRRTIGAKAKATHET